MHGSRGWWWWKGFQTLLIYISALCKRKYVLETPPPPGKYKQNHLSISPTSLGKMKTYLRMSLYMFTSFGVPVKVKGIQYTAQCILNQKLRNYFMGFICS